MIDNLGSGSRPRWTTRALVLGVVLMGYGAIECLAGGTAFAKSRPLYGYVFVNGEYISAPYNIERTEDALRINDLEFTKETFDLTKYEYTAPPRGFGPAGGRRGGYGRFHATGVNEAGFSRKNSLRGGFAGRSAFDRFCDELRGVNEGMIVVLFDGEAPLCVQQMAGRHEFVRALHIPEASAEPIPRAIIDEKDRATWNRLLDEFRGSREFDERAAEEIRVIQAAEDAGNRVIAGSQWMERLSYPMSILAMVLVVVGFGHLLNNRPTVEAVEIDADSVYWSNQRRVVAQSLLIVGLLSAIDLIWTISASNAGMMKEMNPLASGLINEPFRLFLFKASVTSLSIGILYYLHRRPIAQMASWWGCLMLTLLTARWVVFHSMFL